MEAKSNTIEQVNREIVGVGPQGQLWVIADPRRVSRIMLDGIKEPATADRVAGLGNADALVERSCAWKRSGKGKIAYDPAISDVIVEYKPVAVVEARTRRTCQG